MGDFYSKTAAPVSGSSLSSSTMRAEFALIEAAFDKLPALSGNGSKFLRINSGASAVEALSASDVRTALSLVVGTNVQAYDAELAALAGLTSAADRLPYFTGSGTASLATFTAAGRALVDDASAADQLVTLGITASAAELNIMDGVTADASELNILNGVTATTAELNKTDDSAAAISGWVSGMRTYSYVDGAPSGFDVGTNVTESTFESVGPTSSGATNIWTALDGTGAKIIFVNVRVSITAAAAGTTIDAVVYARQTGSSAAQDSLTAVAEWQNIAFESAATRSKGFLAMIPLDASGRFDIAWVVAGTATLGISLYLKGFAV